jgi:CO/xanthine dehydrogenase Mo-binding subunit
MEETPPTYGAYFAEVEVDEGTGKVSVRRIVAAIDVGFAVNPAQCRGQVEGAIAHGIEFALGADLVLRDGFPENTTLVDYQLARAADMPQIDVILIEDRDSDGPYGARGVGTPALTPVLPAIANAIRDAISNHLHRVPMRPEDVANSLRTETS